MNYGYIKFHRQILEWEWYSDLNVYRVFTHLLLKANYEDNRWKGIEIKAGQRLTSVGKLAGETGLKVQQVRTALKKLKSTGEITSQATSEYTIITICNYSYFQGEKEEGQQANQQAKQQTSNKRVTSEQQQRKKDNKYKKDNKIIPPISPNGENPSFEVPDWINQETWEAFEEMRNKKKKEMTDYARRKIVNKLLKIQKDTGQDPNDVLDQSIVNSYQGVFPLKEIKKSAPTESVLKDAKDLHSEAMRFFGAKGLLDINSEKLETFDYFAQKLSDGLQYDDIIEAMNKALANPPPQKIYSWGVINGYL